MVKETVYEWLGGFIFTLLVFSCVMTSGFAAPVDQCVSLNTTYLMDENIDGSQFVNFPLAIEVRAYDVSNNTLDDAECTITTYSLNGNVVDVIFPIHPDKICVEVKTGFLDNLFSDKKLIQEQLQGRLITNPQGFMRYALTLGDKYQSDNTYIVRVDCGNSCTKQTFDVYRPTIQYGTYNWFLGLIENSDWYIWVIVILLILCLVIASILTA